MNNMYRVSGWHEVVRRIVERLVMAPTAAEALRWAGANSMRHVVVSVVPGDDYRPPVADAGRGAAV